MYDINEYPYHQDHNQELSCAFCKALVPALSLQIFISLETVVAAQLQLVADFNAFFYKCTTMSSRLFLHDSYLEMLQSS